MSDESEDLGVIQTLLERFNEFRLPRLLEMKSRVDGGATLTEIDIEYLEHVLADAAHIRTYIDRHPEVQSLYAQATDLYHQVTTRALENAQKPQGG